jgi:hypothetical protein
VVVLVAEVAAGYYEGELVVVVDYTAGYFEQVLVFELVVQALELEVLALGLGGLVLELALLAWVLVPG